MIFRLKKRGNIQIWLLYVIGLALCALSFIVISPLFQSFTDIGKSLIASTSTFYQVLLLFEFVFRYWAIMLMLNASFWAFNQSNNDQEVVNP